MPRYPDIHVRLRSRHPLALIAAVRQALRRAGLGRSEIRSFSSQAFASDGASERLRVCAQWVTLDLS